MITKLTLLLTNRAFISAVLVIIGTVLTAFYGRNFGITEGLTDTLLTLFGGVLNLIGFTVALKTPVTK